MVYPFVPPHLSLAVATFPSASVVSTSVDAKDDQVQPPEVEQVNSKQLDSPLSPTESPTSSHVEIVDGAGQVKSGVDGLSSLNQNVNKSTINPSSIPEIFPPEFTPNYDDKPVQNSAKLLGSGLEIGIPILPGLESGKSWRSPTSFAVNLDTIKKTIHNSQNPPSEADQNISNSNYLPSQKTTYTNSAPNQVSTGQPLRVKFSTLTSDDNPRPSTLEFKSRTGTNSTPTTIDFTSKEQPVIQSQNNQNNQTPATNQDTRRIVEVIADRQEYDEQRRVVTAEGNVVVRFDGAVMDADRVQVSLDNLIAVGDGNVALTRGDQVLRGGRFVYNFIQDSGEIQRGSGEIFIPSAGTDLSFTPSVAGGVPRQPLSDRIRQRQPLTGVGSPGGIDVNLGGNPDVSNLNLSRQGGEVRRIRFEAGRIDFFPRGWQAEDVRLTNDPFSPPELELRANRVTLTRESPFRDRVRTQGQRLVFDGSFSLPIPYNQQVIDRRGRNVTPLIASPGFDGDRRGGLFLERRFEPVNTETVQWSITPQFFAQKAVANNTGNFASLFGLKSQVTALLGSQSRVDGQASLESLDLGDIDNNLRANLRFQQVIGDTRPHLFNLDFNYRDRLYNGTLGFQRVQSSLGAVILSPVIPLGKTGLNATYQAGAQYINANTDRLDLLKPIRDNDLISLGRFQGNAKIFGSIPIWRGQTLPATSTEGLKYTPNPVLPYLNAFGEVNGTATYYTNGDSQNTLIGTIGLEGQIGNFSKQVLDYTGFRLSYSQGVRDGKSPFLFDRFVDNRLLNFGIVQQIYGPFRFGFQTSLNLDNGKSSSTEYSLEYSRRTYGVTLRYNPVLELGGISFRISDFNWTGGTDPFAGDEFTPVVGGVEQR